MKRDVREEPTWARGNQGFPGLTLPGESRRDAGEVEGWRGTSMDARWAGGGGEKAGKLDPKDQDLSAFHANYSQG